MAGYQVSVDRACTVRARIPYGWKLLQVKKLSRCCQRKSLYIRARSFNLQMFSREITRNANLQKFQHGLDVCTYIIIISRFLQIHMLYPLS